MRFSLFHLTLALSAISSVSGSCFCSPANGCKCNCGHSDLTPDSQYSWRGTGQDGYVGNFNCGPNEGYNLASNQNLGGDGFGWRCLYIKCN
ncbi:hypothetical protein CDD80_2803 [Ophiocordyceps camponoti-rufipedis]|uniref:Uncharacterized protein n=1 Tax=Ophiocordyceps camponoti-rufipedis TaxID=2004952 RepID=A0A2C5ZDY5_9HYPO|nr:hypothetical protein CDD80_2803 [Ophiocordyceps camponoti-rufipedis]